MRTLLLTLYFVIVVLPVGMMLGISGPIAGVALLMQLGLVCGYLAFSMLGLEFALIAKIHFVCRTFGIDGLLRWHRYLGIVATLVAIAHVVGLIASGYPLSWLNPWSADSNWAIRWGWMAGIALLALIVSSLMRKRIRLNYEWWQWLHNLLAQAIMLAALVHILLCGGASSQTPMRMILLAYTVVFCAVSIYFQLWRPWSLVNKPWVVVANDSVRSDTRALRLKPKGHEGFGFLPGQFAWLNTGRTPLHKDRHPISMSCAPGPSVEFTIKDLGDWSGKVVPTLAVGETVWVDGPYGSFCPDLSPGEGYVLIGGGVGITPLLSMCESFAERKEARPVFLFYGSTSPEKFCFKERLAALAQQFPLGLTYCIDRDAEGWTGEVGYINDEMLRRHLPTGFERFQYFVCGPGPMMDALGRTLRSLGVDSSRIHTERFEMA